MSTNISKDKEVLICQKQTGCKSHETNCSSDGKLYCKQPSNGYWLDNKIAKPCLKQKGCLTDSINRPCVNQKYIDCTTPQAGYKVLKGIVSEKGCDLSQSKFISNNGKNCHQWPLSSGGSCNPSCNAGYTLSKKTQCKLGTLTEGTCNPNSCDGIMKDKSGKVSIKPNANPHTLNTDEYKAWNSGTCQSSLKSGGKCQPTCGKGYMNVPKESICQTGSLTPSMCVKKPCSTKSPFTVTVNKDSLSFNLHKELSGNKEQYKFSCGGDKVYKTGWDKKYQGDITLTCDKGSINVNNTCQFYQKCPTSFSSQCFQGKGGGCRFNQTTQTLECLCQGNYVGDGTKSGTGCNECIYSQKNICDTHNTQSKCNGDQNCQWTSNKCQIKSGKQEIKQGKMKGCICNPGYYLFNNQCSPYGGSCTNGTLAKQNERTQTNHCGKCDSGFTLDTKNKRCLANPCQITSPSQGTMGNCKKLLESKSQCQPQCNTGYVPSGPMVCEKGKLSQITTCLPQPCTNWKTPANGKEGDCPKSLPSGSSCQPQCKTGYTISGKITCNMGKPTVVSCNPNPCSTTKPTNGDWGSCPTKTIQSGKTCQATCNQGYTINGPSTCNAGTFTSGTCKENTCQLPANTFGIDFPTRPTKLITVKELLSKHNPTLNKRYFNPYGVCSDKQSKTQHECLAKKGTWTPNQGFEIECNTMNGVFTFKHPPQACTPQSTTICENNTDLCNNAKSKKTTKDYGKMVCNEQFTGSIIEGFIPQDYKCSIRNFKVCDGETETNCKGNKNCLWLNNKCVLNSGNTECKTKQTSTECGKNPHCLWYGLIGWSRGNYKQQGCSPVNHISPNGVCYPNTCKCSNGTPRKDCNEHQDEQCSTCKPGYRLVSVKDKNDLPDKTTGNETYQGKKIPGVVASNTKPIHTLTTVSQSICNDRSKGKCICIPNQCYCNHGEANKGDDLYNGKTTCETQNIHSCKVCSNKSNKYFGRYCFLKCNKGEYLDVEPTMTNGVIQGKVCKPHTVCKEGEYEDKAPSGTSAPSGGQPEDGTKTNRICKPITPPCCDKKTSGNCLMYEEKPPSGVSGKGYKEDRVCKPLTLCKGRDNYLITDKVWDSKLQWSPKEGNQNKSKTYGVFVKDNVCKPFKVCNEKEYEDIPPSKNQVTQKLIQDRICKVYKDCQSGEYVQIKGGSGKRQVCGQCPPNSFSIGTNNMSCTAMSSCGPGLMTKKQGSSSNDRTCKACPKGKTSIKAHNDTCPEVELPTKCTCKNGAPLGGCQKPAENCKACITGYVLRKEGDRKRCVSIKAKELCNNGNVKGKIETGKSSCNCIQGYFGGGPWSGSSYPPCKQELKCVCPNGVGATNIPCGPKEKRKCPQVNSKGNIVKQGGKPSRITCLTDGSSLCESCSQGYKRSPDNKKCIKDCQKNQFYDGTNCVQLSVCQKDEYELSPPSETKDRVCQQITKTCPQGQTIIKKHTATSDTVCSQQALLSNFQTGTSKKSLNPCIPTDTQEVTFGLCHIQDIKQYKVKIPQVQGSHLIMSIFGSNFSYNQVGDYRKRDFRNAVQVKVSSILRVPQKSIRILSLQGQSPLRADIEIQIPGKVDELINVFGKQTSPVFLFQINDIQGQTKLYITGVRKMK